MPWIRRSIVRAASNSPSPGGKQVGVLVTPGRNHALANLGRNLLHLIFLLLNPEFAAVIEFEEQRQQGADEFDSREPASHAVVA